MSKPEKKKEEHAQNQKEDKKQRKKEKEDIKKKEDEERARKSIRAMLESADKATDELFDLLIGNSSKEKPQENEQKPMINLDDYSEVSDIALYGLDEVEKYWVEKEKKEQLNKKETKVREKEPFSPRVRQNDATVHTTRTPENQQSETVPIKRTPKSEIVPNMRTDKSETVPIERTPKSTIVPSVGTHKNVTERLTIENLRAIFNKIKSFDLHAAPKWALQYLVITHGLKFYTTFSQLAKELNLASKSNIARFFDKYEKLGATVKKSNVNTYVDLTPMFSDVIIEKDYEDVTIEESSPMYMYIYIKKYKTYIQKRPDMKPDIPDVQEVIGKQNNEFIIKDVEQFYTLIAPIFYLEINANKINVHSAEKILNSLLENTLYRTIAYILSRKRIDNKLGYLMKAIEEDYGITMSEEDVEKIKEIARAYFLVSNDKFLELYSIVELRNILLVLDPTFGVWYKTRQEYINHIQRTKFQIKQLGDTVLAKVPTKSLEEYIKQIRKNPL